MENKERTHSANQSQRTYKYIGWGFIALGILLAASALTYYLLAT